MSSAVVTNKKQARDRPLNSEEDSPGEDECARPSMNHAPEDDGYKESIQCGKQYGRDQVEGVRDATHWRRESVCRVGRHPRLRGWKRRPDCEKNRMELHKYDPSTAGVLIASIAGWPQAKYARFYGKNSLWKLLYDIGQ